MTNQRGAAHRAFKSSRYQLLCQGLRFLTFSLKVKDYVLDFLSQFLSPQKCSVFNRINSGYVVCCILVFRQRQTKTKSKTMTRINSGFKVCCIFLLGLFSAIDFQVPQTHHHFCRTSPVQTSPEEAEKDD